MNIDTTDFSSFTRAEQIRHFEVEGYVVLPSILPKDLIARVKDELASAEMSHTSYSVHQTRSIRQPQWLSRTVAEFIGFPPMIEFLTRLLGRDIVFTCGFFQRTHPRSHPSFHADASPYVRYTSHPEEITLLCPAGTAVIVPSLLLHASHPNRSDQPRELLQFGYRPAWAGPIQPVEEWEPNLVAGAPEIARPYLQSLNTTGHVWEQQHKPPGMRNSAEGINPSRWGDGPRNTVRREASTQ